MKIFKYLFFTLLLFSLFVIYLVLNLGKILDISEEPVKSDIIVSLGGGGVERVKKSFALYEKKFSKNNILILTGDERSKKDIEKNIKDKRVRYLNDNNLDNTSFLLFEDLKSTKDEVKFIKEYLLDNNYSSALIISDPPHTKRIQYLLSKIKVPNDEDLQFNLVKSESSKWWDKNSYYSNKRAQVFAFSEILKLLYSYFLYDFVYLLGIQSTFEEYLSPQAEKLRKEIDRITHKYLKN